MGKKTVRDVLVEALENLSQKSFKRFKNKLNDWEIDEGYSKIPYGILEEADKEDVARLIRNYYTDSYGIGVTLGVLEAIDENQEAENLRTTLKTVSGFASQEPTKREDQGATAGVSGFASQEPTKREAQGATAGDKMHFVDRHRAALIQRVTLVPPILDDLFQLGLLTSEGYDRVRNITIHQDQMRALFDHVQSWGNEDKDQLLQSLRSHNAPLIRNLEGS